MQQGNCDIGTLASSFTSDDELSDENNVKVAVKGQLIAGKFREAIDFFRVDKKNMKIIIIMLAFMPLLTKH